MKQIQIIITLVVMTYWSHAQTPRPADPAQGVVILIGGVAHLGNGDVIENSVIAFDGKHSPTMSCAGSSRPSNWAQAMR